MRLLSCSILISIAFNLSGTAASLREDQITAQELAEELGFSTRKLIFTFDAPVYAKADFVRIEKGRAVHLPMTEPTARSEIPFYYILRNTDTNTKSVTFQIGERRIKNSFSYGFNPSARVHDAYPELKLPASLDPNKPIFVFLDWDPVIDRELKREMSPEEIANKMKQGYYLALYFSDSPFPKP
jgi:hypothetical protein